MTSDFILWSIPGYLALLLFQVVRPLRNRSGWDFVLQIVTTSLFCFLVARLTIFIGSLILCESTVSTFRSWWASRVPLKHSFSLLLGMIPGSIVVGSSLSYLATRPWLQTMISGYFHRITGVYRDPNAQDLFSSTGRTLLGEVVLVTLSNGKIYAGNLVAVTEDPNESNRYIKITPVISGHREKDTFKVRFTTAYIGTESMDETPNRDILIPATQIVTLARFDQKLHEHFTSNGVTLMGWSSKEDISERT